MSIDRLRAAILGVCSGALGTVRTVTTDSRYAVDDAANERVKALLAPTFEITVSSGRRHPTSPLPISNTTHETHSVTIDVKHALSMLVLEAQTQAVRDEAAAACDEMVAALSYPGNLDADQEGNATGAIGGMLFGPDGSGFPSWAIVREDWDKKLLRSRISASAIVQHTRATS